MKHYVLLLGGLLLATTLQAQTPTGRHSIRLGADITTLDAPDDVGLRYVARLARHFGYDRVVVAAEAGYLSLTEPTRPFNGIDPGPNKRERLTADLTVFYDFLRHPNHALRLGVGLSAWYRADDLYRGATLVGRASYAFDRQQRSGVNTAVHPAVEYEWLFHPRWGIDARLRVVNFREAGLSSMLGAGISHRF